MIGKTRASSFLFLARDSTKTKKMSVYAKKLFKCCVKDLIFLGNYIKMEYGKKQKVFFSRPKTIKSVGRESFCG